MTTKFVGEDKAGGKRQNLNKMKIAASIKNSNGVGFLVKKYSDRTKDANSTKQQRY